MWFRGGMYVQHTTDGGDGGEEIDIMDFWEMDNHFGNELEDTKPHCKFSSQNLASLQYSNTEN